MSRAAFIENVAKKGKMSKADAKITVDLVLGEVEAGLKKSKKEGRYTIGNFGTFAISKCPARKGRNPQTGEPIRIKASKVLKFKPSAKLIGHPRYRSPLLPVHLRLKLGYRDASIDIARAPYPGDHDCRDTDQDRRQEEPCRLRRAQWKDGTATPLTDHPHSTIVPSTSLQVELFSDHA